MKIMKRCVLFSSLGSALAIALCLPLPAGAGPLPKTQIAGDAKWLIHLDVRQFLDTRMGKFVADEFLAKKLDRAQADIKRQVDLDLDWRTIDSITAYGCDFPDQGKPKGNLMIKLPPATLQAVARFLQNPEKAGPFLKDAVEVVQKEPFRIFSIHGQVMVGLPSDTLLLVSKSRADLEKACQAAQGKEPNLNATRAFSGYPSQDRAFCFLAVAEGFNQNASLPPQAKVFQMADGAKLTMGEQVGSLFVNLALKAKNTEATQQIQQVVQGMLALVSLSQTKNQDLLELVQSASVTARDSLVSLDLNYPVEKAIKQMAQRAASRSGQNDATPVESGKDGAR
jgi:hypothetical protein